MYQPRPPRVNPTPSGSPILRASFSSVSRQSVYARIGKRALDLVVVAATAPLTLPLLAVLALLVRFRLGAPVLFWQARSGRNGQLFWLCKFRSMTGAVGASGTPLPDEARLTRFGRWLRATSLDELPELWNIARGEMSLVGPRPLLPEYLNRYSVEQARRHEMLPGLTGLAQVEGRNAVSWEERFRQDVVYVDQVSLRLDAWILLRTVACVLLRRGVSAEGHATMPVFQGTADRPEEPISKAA